MAAGGRSSSSRSRRFVQSLFMHQTIYGNFPMLVRWQAHRYVLSQSLNFFHNEFAGRVSQKVMQTALAVRETVTKLLDVFVYVVVYFAGTLVLVGQADSVADGAAPRLARRLYRHPRLFRAALAGGLERAGRCARADDRPHRRQLHQHPDDQALRPYAARAGLCPRRDGRVHGHRASPDAAGDAAHRLRCTSVNSLLLAAVAAHRDLCLAAGHRDARRDRGGDRAGHAHPRHVAMDPVGDRRASSRTSARSSTASTPSPSRSRSTTGRTRRRSRSRAARSASSTRASTTAAQTG